MANQPTGGIGTIGPQLDPQTARLLMAMSGGRGASRIPMQSIPLDKIKRQQQDADYQQLRLGRVDPGLGKWAPLGGVVKGIASQMRRGHDDRRMDELYAQLRQENAEQQAQKAQAAQAQQQQQAEEAERVYQRDQAAGLEAEKRAQADVIAQEEAKRRFEAQYRAPTAAPKPTQQEQIAAISQLPPEQQREAMLAVAPAIVKDRDAQAGAEAARQSEIDELLSLQSDVARARQLQEAGTAYLTGPIAGRLPDLSDASQELNQFYTKLGLERLKALKGSTSEKELDVAFRAGPTMTQNTPANLAALDRQDQAVQSQLARLGYQPGGQQVQSTPAQSNQPPAVNSQQEYDALPSGSVYMEDGKVMKKP